MKFIFSGYLKSGETIALYNVSRNIKYKRLDYYSIPNPSYVTLGDGYIYTYDKTSSAITLHSYLVKGEEMIIVDKKDIPGTNVTHLQYSPKNEVLFGCSYHDGTFFGIKVKEGMFGELIVYQKQIKDERLSRCHQVLLNKEETELAVINIALDAIYFYDITNNKIRYKDIIALPEGCGPRHGIYYGELLYIITEYSNEIHVINRYNKETLQVISTIPNYTGTSYGATLLFSSDYQYLYASNRGEDTIAKFKVLDNHMLEYENSIPVGGKHPRHMILTNDDKYLISCNKDSNNITIINVHKEEVVASIPFGEPTGVIEILDEEI